MEQMENMKNGILSQVSAMIIVDYALILMSPQIVQVLDQEARARLNTIKLTKPEKGQQAILSQTET